MSYHNTALSFSTIPQALVHSFYFMLGNVDFDFIGGTVSPPLSTGILVTFMLFMILLMTNLLIALMGHSFLKINERGLIQWRYEQACIMVDNASLSFKEIVTQPCLFVSMHTKLYTSEYCIHTTTEGVNNHFSNGHSQHHIPTASSAVSLDKLSDQHHTLGATVNINTVFETLQAMKTQQTQDREEIMILKAMVTELRDLVRSSHQGQR